MKNIFLFTLSCILIGARASNAEKLKVDGNFLSPAQKSLTFSHSLAGNSALKDKFAFSGKFPLGINLAKDVSWSNSKMWVNVVKGARDWGYVDRPYEKDPNLKLSEKGYPLSDAGLWFEGLEYQPGVWQFSYKGSGDISFTFGGTLLSTTREADGTVTGTFLRSDRKTSDGELDSVHLIMRNIDPDNPPYDLKVVASGYDLNSPDVFTTEFLDFVKPFKILRYMDLLETNHSSVKTWSDRIKPDAPGSGVAYEDLIELSNITNKEAWITLPHLADDEHIRQTARLFAQKYDRDLNLYLENSNELWNWVFDQTYDLHNSILDQLMAAENLTEAEAIANKDHEQLPQKAVVDRLCHIADIFRQEFGDRADRIKPVLAGQASNSWHISKGLEHLTATSRQSSCNLHAIAIAPYIDTYDGEDFNPNSVDEVFSSMREYYEAEIKPQITEHAELAKNYNLKLYAYEGGQHLTGSDALEIKTAAQNDPRMGQLLQDYFCFWKESGGEDFVYYSSISGNSEDGHWGVKTSISQKESVKHQALIDTIEKGACTK
ncbi:hypothetical protein [Pleurocapsa sp. PCC 7319]|uniref:hypothetical protein n=1 Tax=Pleurocapsa sp. PCC 7319 TaxID=118161 RepID=UPI00034DEE6E|nr:hypothetical protein [Pleurocapsa sp. PCC 7319]